ncbi:Hypothetical protein BFF96_2073 [Corynebacterium pseudotuberculosis]|nr:Hypothetical protein BFF96_2073 [Corynebacterium pseudotuberculosis]
MYSLVFEVAGLIVDKPTDVGTLSRRRGRNDDCGAYCQSSRYSSRSDPEGTTFAETGCGVAHRVFVLLVVMVGFNPALTTTYQGQAWCRRGISEGSPPPEIPYFYLRSP